MILLAIIAVIVIPPDKLPEVAKQVAQFIRELKRMTSGVFDELRQDVVLKPEDMMKQKQDNLNRLNEKAKETAQPIVEVTQAAGSNDEYLKHIQTEQDSAQTVDKTDKKPT